MPDIQDKSTVEAIAREFTSNGRKKGPAMRTIGYAESCCVSGRAMGSVYDNVRVKEAIARIDAKMSKKLNITRESQLTDLQEAKQMARDLKMPSAFVSACREQDNILGLVRDKAPNQEKVDEIRRRMSEEDVLLNQEHAERRTKALAVSKPRLSKENVA